jgi:septin family protein
MANDVAELIYKLAKKSHCQDQIKLQLIHCIVGDNQVGKTIFINNVSSSMAYNGICVPTTADNMLILTQRILTEFLEITSVQNTCDSFIPETNYIVLKIIKGKETISQCNFTFDKVIDQDDVKDFSWYYSTKSSRLRKFICHFFNFVLSIK